MERELRRVSDALMTLKPALKAASDSLKTFCALYGAAIGDELARLREARRDELARLREARRAAQGKRRV